MSPGAGQMQVDTLVEHPHSVLHPLPDAHPARARARRARAGRPAALLRARAEPARGRRVVAGRARAGVEAFFRRVCDWARWGGGDQGGGVGEA